MTSPPRRPSAADSGADGVEIAERSPSHPDAARLLNAFYQEQLGRYGFADPVETSSSEHASGGVFVVMYQNALPAGCGGYRWFDRAAATVEIRKLYVTPQERGRGAGRALLAWLERHAAAAGARRAILETGVRNSAALRLFTSAGYQPVTRYVEGRDPAINRAFARFLTSER